MRLIWCQGGNREASALAVSHGWWYGFRSDDSNWAAALGPVEFIDCHWEEDRLDWGAHLRCLARCPARMATVPDVMDAADVPLCLSRAEEVAQFCTPLIVPKAPGVAEMIPAVIGGREVILGYSVPTSYGGTEVPLWEFRGRKVHLLGGSAVKQYGLMGYANVVSADGNVAWRLARKGIVVNERGSGGKTVKQQDGSRWAGEDAHLEALRRSLVNLRSFWSRRTTVDWRE